MPFRKSHIIILLLFIALEMVFSSCSKRCVVNGCRVRMVHRHDGKKFKSKIRPWYAYQEPRVGRDYKRDKFRDIAPWNGADGEEGDDLLASNDTSLTDDFINDDFYNDSDSLSQNDNSKPGESFLGEDDFFDEEEEEDEKSKKRKKRKGKKGDEEPEKKKPAGDPWDIENLSDDESKEGDF